MNNEVNTRILQLQELLENGFITASQYQELVSKLIEDKESVEPKVNGNNPVEESTPIDSEENQTQITDTKSQASQQPASTVQMPTTEQTLTYMQPTQSVESNNPQYVQSANQNTKSKHGLSKGAIIGIVIAAVVVIAIAVNSGSKTSNRSQPENNPSSSTTTQTQEDTHEHDWVAATCTEPAYCSICGETIGIPGEHTVESWQVTQEASCTSKGLAVGTCSVCGETVEYEIPKTNHTPSDWYIQSKYTIKEDGSVKDGEYARCCTVCGEIIDTYPYTITLTVSQKNAVRQAHSYLSWGDFSYSGLVDQLEFEGYSHDDAVFAVDNCGANWYEQAVKSANSYLKYSAFSREGLIDQLEYEGFSEDEATYGVDSTGADWYEQAAKCAESYLKYMAFSRSRLIDQLEYEGFTYDQAVYGVDSVGL